MIDLERVSSDYEQFMLNEMKLDCAANDSGDSPTSKKIKIERLVLHTESKDDAQLVAYEDQFVENTPTIHFLLASRKRPRMHKILSLNRLKVESDWYYSRRFTRTELDLSYG